MSVDVFISYHSASSQEIARSIKTKLENMGYSCWYSGKDMGGGDYASGIMQALTQCRIFLLILNKASSESAHVLNELEVVTNRLAKKENVVIMPFHVADKEISPAAQYYISRHHWIDATKPPMAKHIDELAIQISQLLSTEEDLLDMEQAKKGERMRFWFKMVFSLLITAALVYGYRALPPTYDAHKVYYLIHILLVSAPMVLLLFENHEKAAERSSNLANYMIIAAVVIFVLNYFDLRSWESLSQIEKVFKTLSKITRDDFTREVIFYGGGYLLLVFYPWHRTLMKTGEARLFWTGVSLLTALWLIVVSYLFVMSVLRAAEVSLAATGLCLWGVPVGLYIIFHNIAERRALKNK